MIFEIFNFEKIISPELHDRISRTIVGKGQLLKNYFTKNSINHIDLKNIAHKKYVS